MDGRSCNELTVTREPKDGTAAELQGGEWDQDSGLSHLLRASELHLTGIFAVFMVNVP